MNAAFMAHADSLKVTAASGVTAPACENEELAVSIHAREQLGEIYTVALRDQIDAIH